MVRVFLAGIIQGSIAEKRIHGQDYRHRIISALRRAIHDVEIFDPISDHPNSLDYPAGRSRDVFFELMRRAGETDVLVAFVPEASMGTAVEMWRAREEGVLVLTVSPMLHNWVIRFLSDRVYETLGDLEAASASGELGRIVEQHLARRSDPQSAVGLRPDSDT
jgi:hypothetical protein